MRTEHSVSKQYKEFQSLKVEWLTKRRSKPHAPVPIRSDQQGHSRRRVRTRDASAQIPGETAEYMVSIDWGHSWREVKIENKLDNGAFITVFKKHIAKVVGADAPSHEESSTELLKFADEAMAQCTAIWLDLRVYTNRYDTESTLRFDFDDLVKWMPKLLSAEKLRTLYHPRFYKLDQVEKLLALFLNLTKAYIVYDCYVGDYHIDWQLMRTPAFLRLHSLRMDLPRTRFGLDLKSPPKDCAEDEILRYCYDFSALPHGQEKRVHLSGVSLRFVDRLFETIRSCTGPLTVLADSPEEYLWEVLNRYAERLSLVEAEQARNASYKQLESRSSPLNVFLVKKTPNEYGVPNLKTLIVSTTDSVRIKGNGKDLHVSCMEDFEYRPHTVEPIPFTEFY